MRFRAYNFMALALILVVFSHVVDADSEKNKEYQIKAAFLYNFINFIDWPKEEKADVDESITIGIIGSEDFTKACEPIKRKKIKERNISIKYFAGYEKLKKSNDTDDSQWNKKIEALKVCNVLIFCNSNLVRIKNPNQIIKALEGLPILTVGETEHFLESGGVINFLMEDEKVCFEINNSAAKQAKLNIRSKLLRLAKKVIKDETPDKTGK
jgi:hypothetical protein